MRKIALDIILITAFRPQDLNNCLESLRRAVEHTRTSSSFGDIRITIGLNGIPEQERGRFVGTLEKFNRDSTLPLQILSFERLPVGAARNRLLDSSDGDWIFFCDDDIEVPEKIFSDWAGLLQENPTTQVFGGPNLTPVNATKFEKIQGRVIGSALGGGPFRRRYSATGLPGRATAASLTLCNLFVRRTESITRRPRFPELALGGEELDYLAKFSPPFFWSPELHVFHRRRATIAAFFRQMVKYGVGRTHVYPLQVGLVLIAIAIFARTVVTPPRLTSLIFLYGALISANSFAICRQENRIADFFSALLLHPIVHVGYFVGLVKGLFPGSRHLHPSRE